MLKRKMDYPAIISIVFLMVTLFHKLNINALESYKNSLLVYIEFNLLLISGLVILAFALSLLFYLIKKDWINLKHTTLVLAITSVFTFVGVVIDIQTIIS